ncbi:NAC domain-containing protein 72-like [Nicotiana tabacum]|uniref:NAC domain-containing protein 72-like n=1 Tax=Nicotiana tabacum TaxID=4097 RepID=A0A1S3ZXD4_TOBAC|nr:PREDICTED: NAC domain-containing protein 72-like [Nicotiana tabacum]
MDMDRFLIQQLNNKFKNQPLSIDRLIFANINDFSPQDFFQGEINGGGIKECYVLTPRRRLYGIMPRPDRRARNGYWKLLKCIDDNILGTDGTVGMKQKLLFFEGDPKQARKTHWCMIEYKLRQHCCSITCDHNIGRLDDWVLCKVYEEYDPETLSFQMETMDIG